MLRLVHLADQANKLPSQLSGGQQQRVALARALAIDPALLLLDEPLSALDAKVREELRTEITTLKRRLGITTIMVTHDQEEALTMADLVVVMRDGAVEQVGSPTELYAAPATPFVAGFIGRMNLIAVAPNGQGKAVFAGRPLRLAADGAVPRTLGIRPEEVDLCEADAAGENVVAGAVVERIYLGNIVRLVVAPDGGAALLTVERHGARDLAPIGARVGLRLPPEALKPLA
jgi:iron(III) transport system ATP-binding protein